MKGILFFLVILGIGLVAWMSSSAEGFQNAEKPVIPLISPRYQTLTKGEVLPFSPPSTTLLAPPPGQSSSVNTQPASDPALEKAVSGRIQSVYESVLGFFKTDATGLQKLGDPSIQLPLSTARSDMGRLKDEIAVLSRNPGLESNLTGDDLDAIEANFGYLQRKWRMSTNALSGSPMPPTEGFQSGGQFSSYEGFQGASSSYGATSAAVAAATAAVAAASSGPLTSGTGAMLSGGSGLSSDPTSGSGMYSASTSGSGMYNDPTSGSGMYIAPTSGSGMYTDPTSGSGMYNDPTSGSGPSSAPTSGSGPSSGSGLPSDVVSSTPPIPPTSSGSDISLKDLQDLSLAINVEIIRLQSSGTTDLNTQSRINILTSINKTVADMISEVTSGTRKLKDIPILRADIARFLPAMKNMNTAIPELVKESGMSSFLNSLFPKFGVGDISGTVIGKAMFDAYGKDFFKNLSWDVGFSYKGQAEQEIAKNQASAAANTLAAATSGQSYDDRMASGAQAAGAQGPSGNAAPSDSYRGLLSSVVSSGGVAPTYVSAGIGGAPAIAGKGAPGPPATFDWKERSKQICGQITARGMDPNDFGCLADPDKMNRESFSWRGYTRMVCDRLNTVYDTSVPFLCGCPPQTWPGWRQ